MIGKEEFSLRDIDRIIVEDEAADLMVRVSQALGRELARRKLAARHLLGLFGEVRRIEKEWRQRQGPEERLDPRIWRRLQALSPSGAYQESRGRGDAMVPLIEALERAVDRVERNSDFQRFLDFFHAILAYLRFY